MTTAREDFLRSTSAATVREGEVISPYMIPASLLAEALALLDVERMDREAEQRAFQRLQQRVDDVVEAVGSQTLVDGGLVRKLLS